jgi:rubrerythrin
MDPTHFSGSELIEMAIRIEENGGKFYSDAGKASKSTALKKLFKDLSEEESRHRKVFMDLRKLVPDEELSMRLDPYSEDDMTYLYALADSEVFTGKGSRLAQRVRSERSALNLAIAMEKDSILFYIELLGMVREKDRSILDDLINEEKEHLRKLSALLKTL